jgi:hypothetical protein
LTSRRGRTEVSCPDNGAGYRSILHALACRALGVRHLRTRPYRARTNGKAERFIRTLLGGWAYGAIYGTSAERTRALPGWLDHYNHRRPHRSEAYWVPRVVSCAVETLRAGWLQSTRFTFNRGSV